MRTLRPAFAALLLGAVAPGLSAQVDRTWVIPRGVLRLSFSPWYTSYDQRFAADGSMQALGADLSGDSLPATFFPTMVPATLALRAITGDSTLAIRLGKVQNAMDADIRRFPLALDLGLTSRLSFSVNVPIVTVRLNNRLTIDSTRAGWNQAVGAGGNTAAFGQIQTLLNQLDQAASAIEANIAAGQYGCPAGAQCAQAQALVTRTRAVRDNLIVLTGVGLSTASLSGNPPPFAPLAGSPEGAALTAALQTLATQLATFGATVTGTLPLPTAGADSGAVQTVLTDPTYGYGADSLTMHRRTRLGDVELGLHYGLAQSPHFRALLTGTVRLPTGNLASPSTILGLSTGDHQTDLEGRLDLAMEPGQTLALWFSGSYTMQLPDQLSLRVVTPHTPVALATTERVVQRDLGDMAQLSFGPMLRLSDEVRVYGTASYFWKGTDAYTDSPLVDLTPGSAAASVLDQESGMTTWSFGGGVSYRSTRAHSGERLPIEAGLSYTSAFSGSGGFTPQGTTLGLYLRLFYRLWGGPPPTAPLTAPPKAPGN